MSLHSTFHRLFVFFCRSLPVAVFLLLANYSHAHGQASAATGWEQIEMLPSLSLGPPRTGHIPGRKQQGYPIHLEAGQYVKVIVTQIAINLDVQMVDTERKPIALAGRDGQGSQPEVLETVAEQSGTHTLLVVAIDISEQRVPYEVQLVELRPATPREKQIAKATRRHREALALYNVGKHNEAIAALREAAVLRKEHLGENHYDHAESLNLLGNVYREAGDSVKALNFFLEVRKIWESVLPPNHRSVLNVLNNLGLNYNALGDFELAEDYLRRTLAIREQLVGKTHMDLVATLNNLAIACRSLNKYAEAVTLFRRTIEIFKSSKVESRIMAAAYSNLGAALMANGEPEEAEAALKESLAMTERLKISLLDPDRILTYVTWASVYFSRRDYGQAEASALKAIGICEKWLSPENPKHIEALINLSATYLAMGKAPQVIELRARAHELREQNLRRNLAVGSERQKLAMVEALAKETNSTISLHAQVAADNPRALELAFTTWLRRKGRALDEMNRTTELMRRHAGPEAAEIFDRLTEKLRAYTSPAMGQPSEKARAALKQLDEEIEQLQAELSKRSAQFRVETQALKLADVQNSLPPNSALIEFARYSPVEASTRKESDPHYLAYILTKDGPPQWVELGDAEKIDGAVAEWRTALNPKQTGLADPRSAARKLDKLVMQPIRPLLGKTRQVFLAPDGMLNLVPFAALLNERGRYLVQDYLFIYLTSGSDLLRLQIRHEGQDGVIIFAAPDYDDDGGGKAADEPAKAESTRPISTDDGRRGRVSQSRSASAMARLEPLTYASAEAEAIKRLWQQAQLFLGRQATESAIKQVKRPRILHVVTHGIFLEDQEWEARQREARGQAAAKPLAWENALLRSWLAFAGANGRRSGAEDGILTAYEAAALDLWGTKLVVLSACQTGVGEVKNGEGVYGLRRALVLAGAETQLTSLWRVDDDVTKDLMTEYHRKLRDRVGRAEALRQVQLRMLLRDRARRNPYYWAGFIQIGEWANLDGVRPASIAVSQPQRATRKP